MRTVADFRRAAVAGSVWQCTNHLHPHVSGERRIIGGTKNLRFAGTKADGSTFSDGGMDIPRRAEVRIDGDLITWLRPDGSDAYTWTLVRDEPADEGHAERAAEAATPAAPVTASEPTEIDAEKRTRRVRAYAAKLSAETIRDEDNPRPVDPTDDVLAKTFEHCGRPAPVDMYDEIRAAYAEFVAAWEDERYEAAKARYAALLNRPDVAAVAARLATLTDEERRHLDAAYRQHFRLYRSAQSELTHRCGKAYSERAGDKYGYRDVLYVAGQVAWATPPPDPSSFAANAAEDYVKVLLWGDLLTENERPIFAGPWAAVIGEDRPRAVLRERAEAYVSPWATV